MKISISNLTICYLFLFYLCSTISFSQEIEKKDSQILNSNSRLERVFNDGFFTEGAAVGLDGLVYFSDITLMQAGHIWKYDPKTNKTHLFRSPSGKSNGIIFDLKGDMILALGADFGGRCIVHTNLQTGKSKIIAGTYNGKSLNSPNDLVIDEAGRIYFTDPRYVGHEPLEQPVMGVYRIDLDGTLTRIIEQAGTPNGILISPSQEFLYIASANMSVRSELNAVLRFALDKDGNVSNREVFIDFEGELGPDGMAIDLEGNLYLARTDGIHVYSAEGALLDFISIPERATNVTFGHGETESFLFITAGKSLYKIKINARGYFASK